MGRRKSTKAEKKKVEEEAEDGFDMPEDCDLYGVLGLEKTATANEIRSAYRKKALLKHPDKCAPEDRHAAHQVFQQIAFAYAVLSNDARRKRYDATGRTDEGLFEDGFEWGAYFKDLYQGIISGETIEAFRTQYQGSDEERKDIMELYSLHEGSMELIIESLLCSEVEDEPRVRRIIHDAIDAGEVTAYAEFKRSEKTYNRRKNAAAKEAIEAAELKAELGLHQKGGDDGLAALIKKRSAGRVDDLIASLESKYGPGGDKKRKKKKRGNDISDEAFAAAQSKLNK